MSVASQIKTPGQVKGPGSGAGASFSGTSGQITLGDGTAADNVPAGAFDNLSAAEIPSGIDAAKIGDGSVSTTEFQYINTLSSNAQTQISAKQALITGTPTGTKFARDTGAWSAIADGDLPSTSNNSTISGISTVANAALPKAGYSTGSAAMTGALAFTGTQNSAGASIANIWRNSNGDLNTNVANTKSIIDQIAGNTVVTTSFSATNFANAIILSGNPGDPGSGSHRMFRNGLGNLSIIPASFSAVTIGDFQTSRATLTGSLSLLEVQTSRFTLRSQGTNFTNNGTWTNFYDLSAGTHNGEFHVFSNAGGGKAIYKIAGTTLGAVVTTADGVTFVDAGSVAVGNVGFRVSGGWLQINVGTSVSGSLYYHTEYHGNVR